MVITKVSRIIYLKIKFDFEDIFNNKIIQRQIDTLSLEILNVKKVYLYIKLPFIPDKVLSC